MAIQRRLGVLPERRRRPLARHRPHSPTGGPDLGGLAQCLRCAAECLIGPLSVTKALERSMIATLSWWLSTARSLDRLCASDPAVEKIKSAFVELASMGGRIDDGAASFRRSGAG